MKHVVKIILIVFVLFTSNKSGHGQDTLDVKVYPNPFISTAFLEIDVPYTDTLDYEILNTIGTTIHSHSDTIVDQGVLNFEIGQHIFNDGVYFVRVNFDTSEVILKIIKISSTHLTTIETSSENMVWPNPFENVLNIETLAQFESCQLINMKGEVVLRTHESKLDTESLTSGLYLIIIQTDRSRHEFKVIKK